MCVKEDSCKSHSLQSGLYSDDQVSFLLHSKVILIFCYFSVHFLLPINRMKSNKSSGPVRTKELHSKIVPEN